MRLRILLILLVATSVFADEAGTAHRFDQIRINPLLLRRFLEAMPKGGDLHEHLSGAVYAETYLDWAMQDGLCIDKAQLTIANPPCDEPHGLVPAKSMNDALRSQLIDALSMRNFHPAADNGHDHFFATFTKFRAVSARHVPEMLANVATRFASENVDYLESLFDAGSGAAARFGATLTPGASFAEMRDALLKSGKVPEIVAFSSRNLDQIDAAAHKASPNTTIRYLVQVHRGIPREQFFSELVIAFELASTDPRVVGLNPVMPEDGYASMKNFDDQMEMFAYLRPLYPKVHLSAHAGELAPGLVPPEGLRNHIRDTVMIAKAERIGHGVDGRNHPLRLYMRNDVPVVLATDDPGVARGDMTNEFQRAVEEHGFTYAELKRVARNSIDYSFIEGPSLWTNARYEAYVCGNACDAFIAKSAKAREEWRLEQRLRDFEAAH